MLGHRGCRLGITYPEIYEMQAAAIFEAAVAVTNPDDYASVDARVKAGDIQASAFGGAKSGLMPHFTWSGPGKHTLRADLGAGNLVLRR